MSLKNRRALVLCPHCIPIEHQKPHLLRMAPLNLERPKSLASQIATQIKKDVSPSYWIAETERL